MFRSKLAKFHRLRCSFARLSQHVDLRGSGAVNPSLLLVDLLEVYWHLPWCPTSPIKQPFTSPYIFLKILTSWKILAKLCQIGNLPQIGLKMKPPATRLSIGSPVKPTKFPGHLHLGIGSPKFFLQFQVEPAHCPRVQIFFTSKETHPCSKIVNKDLHT